MVISGWFRSDFGNDSFETWNANVQDISRYQINFVEEWKSLKSCIIWENSQIKINITKQILIPNFSFCEINYSTAMILMLWIVMRDTINIFRISAISHQFQELVLFDFVD